MNAVGIDVSKEKSTVVILRPFGEVVAAPYDVSHTDSELDRLPKLSRSCPVKHGSSWKQRAFIMNQLPDVSMNMVYLFP